MAHLLYNSAIFLLYSTTFFTFDFNVVSPLQKLMGSLLSLLYTEIIRNGKAHIKQDTSPIIFPTTMISSVEFKFVKLIISRQAMKT